MQCRYGLRKNIVLWNICKNKQNIHCLNGSINKVATSEYVFSTLQILIHC